MMAAGVGWRGKSRAASRSVPGTCVWAEATAGQAASDKARDTTRDAAQGSTCRREASSHVLCCAWDLGHDV